MPYTWQKSTFLLSSVLKLSQTGDDFHPQCSHHLHRFGTQVHYHRDFKVCLNIDHASLHFIFRLVPSIHCVPQSSEIVNISNTEQIKQVQNDILYFMGFSNPIIRENHSGGEKGAAKIIFKRNPLQFAKTNIMKIS